MQSKNLPRSGALDRPSRAERTAAIRRGKIGPATGIEQNG